MTVSEKQATEWLKRSLNKKYASNINKYVHIYHWTQNEFMLLLVLLII